jgi:hypothetical protein
MRFAQVRQSQKLNKFTHCAYAHEKYDYLFFGRMGRMKGEKKPA